MQDSQIKSINLLKSGDSQKPFSSITLKKDSRGGTIVFNSSHDIVPSIEGEPSLSLKQLSEGMILAQQQQRNVKPLR